MASKDQTTTTTSCLPTPRNTENEYRMTAITRGSCLIINNEKFKHLRCRKGTQKDRDKFEQIINRIGFSVEVANNLDSKNMKERLKTFADKENANKSCDATMIIILSHGHERFICGTAYKKKPENKDYITYEEIVAFFNNTNCPNLKNKPKIFFFQACLGDKISYAEDDGTGQGHDVDETIRFPDTSNVLLSFSTQKGFKSWRDTAVGSYYPQSLSYVLAKRAHEMELSEMLMLVEQNMRRTVAPWTDKVLCLTTYVVLLGWTKKFFFYSTDQIPDDLAPGVYLDQPIENFQLTLAEHNSNSKGLCLIINNIKPINSLDEKKLKDVFESLNFLVDVQSDLTTDRMKEELEKIAKTDPNDAVIIIILSYGDGERVYGNDDKEFPNGLTYDDIVKFFNNEKCPLLRDKPKLFFFQVCHKRKRYAVGDSPGSSQNYLFKSHSLAKFPETSDVLLWFALYKDCTTESGEHVSSAYVSSLHKVLTQLEEKTEIKDIILAVDREFRSVRLKSTEPATSETVSLNTSVELVGWSKIFYLTPYTKDLTDDMIKEGLLLVLGGYGRPEVEAFISSEQRWVRIKNIRDAPSSSAVGMAYGHTIFIMEEDNHLFRSFNTIEMKWKKLPDPTTYREGATVSLSQNEIYLIGGKDNAVNLCEVFDINTEMWSETTKTNVHRVYHGSASIEGVVFCAGGKDEINNGVELDSVEYYDREKRNWTFVASMLKPRSHHSLVAFAKYMCTVGGHNASGSISGNLDIYDSTTDVWRALAPMPTKRNALSANFFNGLLYAIGGYDAQKSMSTVEAYNPGLNSWMNVSSLSFEKYFHTSVVLKHMSCSQLEDSIFPEISSSSLTSSKDLTEDLIKEGVLIVMGGDGEGSPRSEVEAFIPSEQEWFKIRNIRDAPFKVSVAVTDQSKIFVLEYENMRFRSLDLLDMQWKSLRYPLGNRKYYSGSLIRNEIFWMGGDGEDANQCDVYNITEDSWSKTTQMIVHRVTSSLAALQEKLFCAGGKEENNDGPYLDSVESYDRKKRVWSYVAPMSVPRSYPGLVSFGPYLWALGGFNNSGTVQVLEIFDPEKDFWITLKPMIKGRYLLTATFLDNKLYAVGGYRGGPLITVDIYDPEKDEWTAAPSLNWKRDSHACLAFHHGVSTVPRILPQSVMPFKDLTNDLIKEGFLLIMGGVSGGCTRSEVEAFIPKENKWFKIRNFRDAPCHESVAVTDRSTVFVLEYTNKRFRSLDPLEMKWKRLSDPPIYRRITSASLIRNEIFWMEENGEDGNQCDVYNITKDTWSTTTKMNVHRTFPSSAALKDKLFCAGGREGKEEGPYLDSVESYDPLKRIWTFVASMSVPRSYHSLVSFGPYLWALGGETQGVTGLSVTVPALEIYDPEKNIWITLKPMLTARSSLTVTFFGKALFAVGGKSGEEELNTVEVYDFEKDKWTTAPPLNWKRKFHAAAAFQHGVFTIPRIPSHPVKPFKDLTADLLKKGVLVKMGGFGEGLLRTEVEAFIPSEKKWFKIRNITDAPYAETVAVTNGSTVFVLEVWNKRFRSFVPLEMKWKRLSYPLVHRNFISLSLIRNEILSIGGYGEDGNQCDVYNITQDSWSRTSKLNVHRLFPSSAALQGKIFCAGGREKNNEGPILDSMEFYDLEKKIWTLVASMSVPRCNHSLVSFGPYLWALGGFNLSGYIQNLEIYDSRKDVWISLKPMYTARSGITATFLGNRLYAAGGYGVEGDLISVEVYDPETDEWTVAPSLNSKTNQHVSVAFPPEVSPFPKMPSHSVMPFKDLTEDMIMKGVLLVMGGHTGSTVRSEMEAFISSKKEWVKIRNITDAPNHIVVSVTDGRTIYVMDIKNKRFRSLNPFEMKWKRLTNPPEYRNGMTASLLGEEIFLMGGETANGSRCDVYNTANHSWSETPKMEYHRVLAASGTIKGKVFCAGGKEENDTGPTLASVECYDPKEKKWAYAATMGTPRYSHSLVAFSRYLWAVGGENSSGVVTELEIFSPDETNWRILSHMPTGRSNLSATFFRNRLYAIGGSTGKDETNCVEIYDPKKNEWTISVPLKWGRQGHAAFALRH